MPTKSKATDEAPDELVGEIPPAAEAHLLSEEDVRIVERAHASEALLPRPGTQVYFVWYASPPPGVPGPNDAASLALYPAIVTYVLDPAAEYPLCDLFVMFRENASNQREIKFSPVPELGYWTWLPVPEEVA